MKLLLAAIFAAMSCSTAAFAQDAKLPNVLQPDAESVAAADRSGFGVFKLLPRGMFDSQSYKDEENPTGIRGGGAYYSFTNRVHSYNKVAQIELQDGNLMVGFAGADYGFIRDLGSGKLAEIPLDSEVLKFLAEYKPPTLHDEIRKEKKKSSNYETDSGKFSRSVPAVAGHVYALRAISFGDADILVAFQVMSAGKDGSLTIVWKRIKEFEIPKLLYQADETLRAKVEPVLRDPRFQEVTATIGDDQVTLSGTIIAADLPQLLTDLQEKAGSTTRIHNRLRVK